MSSHDISRLRDLLAAAAYQAGGRIVIEDQTLCNIGPMSVIRIERVEHNMTTVVTLDHPHPPKPRKAHIEDAEFHDVTDERALPKPLARLSRD